MLNISKKQILSDHLGNEKQVECRVRLRGVRARIHTYTRAHSHTLTYTHVHAKTALFPGIDCGAIKTTLILN